MWLVVHLRALGFKPAGFAHATYQSYVEDVERQYNEAKLSCSREEEMKARITARALVHSMGLERTAGDAVPRFSPLQAQTDPGNGLLEGRRDSPAFASADSVGGTPCSAREIKTCKRKIRHRDYLSAFQHASRLRYANVHIYRCPCCQGLHVGHPPNLFKLRKADEELASIESRLGLLESETRVLERRRIDVQTARDALVRFLEKQADLATQDPRNQT